MGPNSFRNLTYAAVLLVVGALVYLIYQSSQKKKQQALSTSENVNSGINGFTDTLGSLAGSSIASLPSDSVSNSVDGQYVSGKSPSTYNTQPLKDAANSDVKDVIAEDPISKSDEGIASSEKKAAKSAKSGTSVATKSVAPAAKKFDAGNAGSGEYLVMAGSFASTDNALALVDKLKKLGYKNAEAVKLENSANTHVVAGFYDFKGGAEAAVRALKSNKVESFVKKKSGEIYKAAPTATPKSPTKPSAPISKPI
jgi:SPOR domain